MFDAISHHPAAAIRARSRRHAAVDIALLLLITTTREGIERVKN